MAFEHRQVWDPVTRSWHWLLAISVVTGWILGESRTFSTMQWHMYAGYCTGSLLMFRIAWGIWGPQPTRLRNLIPSRVEFLAYLGQFFRRSPSGSPGHSPTGAVATLVILLLLATQVISGLMSEDDGLFYSGPLASEVSSETVRSATRIHNLVAKGILVMVCLHLAVMVFYRIWKKENLVIAMVTGRKLVRSQPDPTPGYNQKNI